MNIALKHLLVVLCCLNLVFSNSLLAQKQDFLSDKKVMNGFIQIAYDNSSDSVYIGIKKSQVGQKMLFQSSLPHGVGSNDIGLDRGQLGMTRLVRFERFGNKLMLKQLNTEYRANSDNQLERESIDQAFADSIIAGFKLESENDEFIYLNYTDFLLSDIHDVSGRLSQTGQGAYNLDSNRSGIYLPKVKSFEKNTELEAVVTFSGSPKGAYIKDVTPDPKSVSVHLHHSFIALPDDEYKPRAFHPFSGFWKHSYMDYAVPIEDDMEQAYIPRHRLTKKTPGAAKSEAITPIVYYLDPGIPEPVMTALKEGALWWNQAFEAAGFVDAFQVKVLPADADPMDVRYNVIQWVHRATRGWSYGSSVIDPRTGEIIKGHVTLGSLRVRQDYLIALGMTSPLNSENADTSKQKELALDRIRQLSAHEVGHTLGIAHNFAASEINRASVMDYPHPLFSLGENGIEMKEAYDKGIGEWDKYVVSYGYAEFDGDESQALAALIQQAKEAGHRYKSDPDARIAKRASADGHLWDNGDNAIAEYERMISIREKALANFGMNSLPFDAPISDLEERLVPIYYSHRFQLDALVKQISGLHYQYDVKTLTNANQQSFVKPVSGENQRQAMALMLESLHPDFLSIPSSIVRLIPPKAYGSSRNRESMQSRMGIAFDPITAAESVAGYTSTILLDPNRLNRLAFQHSQDTTIPSVKELLEALFEYTIMLDEHSLLSERIKQVILTVYFDVLDDESLAPEVKSEMQAQLLVFERWLEKHKKKANNEVTLRDLATYWKTRQWPARFPIKPMPPGSPI